MKRTCGTCGWWEEVDKEDGRAVDGACLAIPVHSDDQGRRAVRRFGWLLPCAFWKPDVDWRKQMCQTCEFYGNLKNSHDWCMRHAGLHEMDRRDAACADWMPTKELEKEEENDG